jgi:Pilus assembly protein, PilP
MPTRALRTSLLLTLTVMLSFPTTDAVSATDTAAPLAPRKEKLEGFDYFDLVLVGTAAGNDGKRVACFQLPDGSRQAAGADNRLGKNRAYISRVNEQSIEVTELLPVNGGTQWAVSRFFWPVADPAPAGGTGCPDNREPVDAASVHETVR